MHLIVSECHTNNYYRTQQTHNTDSPQPNVRDTDGTPPSTCLEKFHMEEPVGCCPWGSAGHH